MTQNTLNQKFLRSEAAAFHWQQLNEHQLFAFSDILGFINEAVDQLDDSDQFDKQSPANLELLLPWFDRHRENRVVLLQGARGTGKTSVLLSLIWACVISESQYNDSNKPFDTSHVFRGGQFRSNGSNSYPKTDDLESRINKLRQRTIWLEPLDMETLPCPTNLLAAILARIGQIAKHYMPARSQVGQSHGTRGILENNLGSLEAFQQLQFLQADVAMAWDGNILERGEHLDPDAYSMEVIRAENARLSLNNNLAKTLDGFSDSIFSGSSITNPLFILPIDDVDLNPIRCLEILRLLKMISVPRLFVVVLGEIDMIEVLLNLKYAGEFIDVAGNPGKMWLNSNKMEIRKKSTKVTYNTLRKLFPPVQRVSIGKMKIWETLNYYPKVTRGVELHRFHTLLQMWPANIEAFKLKKFETLGGREIESLWDFIMYPVPYHFKNDIKIKKEDIVDCSYQASALFQLPFRNVVDWWFFLHEIDPYQVQLKSQDKVWQNNTWNKFIDMFGRHCRSAIGEDMSLSLEHQQKYRRALKKNKLTGRWELALGITAIPHTGAYESIYLKIDSNPGIKKRFQFCDAKGWCLAPGFSDALLKYKYFSMGDVNKLNDELFRLIENSSLSKETTCALMFFHDLLALGPGWKNMKKDIKMRAPVEIWAITQWEFRSKMEAVFWPAPAFLSFWNYDIFLSHWSKAITYLSKIEHQYHSLFLIYAWIDSASAALLFKSPIFDQRIKNYEIQFFLKIKNWNELAIRVESLFQEIIDVNDPRTMLVQGWLIRLGNFLMPEISGLELKYVKTFGEQVKLKSFWLNCSADVIQLRKEMFDRLEEVGFPDVNSDVVNKDENSYLNALGCTVEPKHNM